MRFLKWKVIKAIICSVKPPKSCGCFKFIVSRQVTSFIHDRPLKFFPSTNWQYLCLKNNQCIRPSVKAELWVNGKKGRERPYKSEKTENKARTEETMEGGESYQALCWSNLEEKWSFPFSGSYHAHTHLKHSSLFSTVTLVCIACL